MLYFFLLFPLNNCLYITEGISILEEGYNFGIQNQFKQQECQSELDIFCINYEIALTPTEKNLREFILEDVHSILDAIEPDYELHSYYEKSVHQLLKELIFYDIHEEYLTILFDFRQFLQEKEVKKINEKYVISLDDRQVLVIDKNNNTFQNQNNTIFVNFEDFYIPSSKKKLNFQINSQNIFYPPDQFNIKTTQKMGSIIFSEPVYISTFFVWSQYGNSKIILSNNETQIDNYTINQKNQWLLFRGPYQQQINNITIDKQTIIDSILIKTKKIQYTADQISGLVIERLVEKYYNIHPEKLLKKNNIEEEKDKLEKQKFIVVPDELDFKAVKLLLEFLEKVLFEIKKLKQQESKKDISSSQILTIIQNIQNDMNQKEIEIFKNTLQQFFQSEYDENQIEQLYKALLFIKQSILEDQTD